jgi:predicted nucleotidyltransferase
VENQQLKNNILRVLLYYDIFDHPLREEEVYCFLPENSVAKEDVFKFLREAANAHDSFYGYYDGYVYISTKRENIQSRLRKEKSSEKMWRIAGFMTHIIKRFPFVKAVFVTGSLSKNSIDSGSDIDLMVITVENRIWVVRMLLMLFKKIFLFNSYKYFCINYFISETNLEIPEKNIFTATEIAHLKVLFNEELLKEFINKNIWVKNFFPNYEANDSFLHKSGTQVNNRKSLIQKFLEIFFAGKVGDYFDRLFMKLIVADQQKKYKHLDESERKQMFENNNNTSRTHPANMQTLILNTYYEKLKQYNL